MDRYSLSHIVLAFFLHIWARHTSSDILSKLFNFIRIFLYISLFSSWGISVHLRVTQIYPKKFLNLVTILMVSWLIVREFKFRFVLNEDVLRYLWYFYYIPILVIPLLALFTSLSLGKTSEYRLPKKSIFLSFLTGVFILFVLTNDFHQLVFSFPVDSAIRSEHNCHYEPVYYMIAGWVLFCSLSAFLIMLNKSRIAQNKKARWMPVLPIGIAVVYNLLYYSNLTFIRIGLGDFAVTFCLISIAFFESCLQCGLIQTNSHYPDFFHTLAQTPVVITDSGDQVRYVSDSREPISKEDLKSAKENSPIIHGGRRLYCDSIRGGHVYHAEDISEFLALQTTLNERHDELMERNALLQYEYEKEREHQTIKEQNRLYDLLQKKTQKQMEQINRLTEHYRTTKSWEDKQKILADIIILGTYIKRRKDFVLSEETSSGKVSEDMLIHALSESFHALKLSRIQGGFFVQTENSTCPETYFPLAYDFFEEIVETLLDTAHYINVRITDVNGTPRVNILTDSHKKAAHLSGLFPDIHIEEDSDGTEFILPLTGGEMP